MNRLIPVSTACRRYSSGAEHEQEFQRLGYPGQERGDGHGQQHTAYHRTTRFRRRQIHRQRRTRQTKHHDWEEAGHEHPRGAVAGVEAVDVAVEHSASGVSELTNLEPAMVFST